MADRPLLFSIFRWIGRVLEGLRRTLHLVFMLAILLLIVIVLSPQVIVVPESAALVIAPKGTLVEQLSGNPFDRALAQIQGVGQRETLLSDLIDAIKRGKDDRRIKALVLDLDELGTTGLSKLEELAAEIDSFAESGKPVISIGDSYTRDQYYLAAGADKIYMNPMGMVLIDGYSKFSPYYKSLLDMVYVDYNAWTAGEYKSFLEPVTRDSMSDPDKVATGAYLDALWSAYREAVSTRRSLDAGALQRYADEFGDRVSAAAGDTGELALDYGLVDELLSRGEIRDRIAAAVSPDARDTSQFPAIGYDDYLASGAGAAEPAGHAGKIAVIVMSGEIYDGVRPPGSVGGDSAASLIREITLDTDYDALVMRVDSPGGSAFASDVILQELERFQATGRPLVVSMSAVAASGGYWISMSADEIWASPTTLTGSIGVGAMLPTYQRLLDKVGVHVDGIGTTRLDGQFDAMRGLGDDARKLYAGQVEYLYSEFVSKVAANRERPTAEVEPIARGRVWVGSAALERGLVDRLGGFDQAVEAAARLAGLAPGTYSTKVVEPELGFAERLTLDLAKVVQPAFALFDVSAPWSDAVSRLVDEAAAPLELAAGLNDPRGLYALCFCGQE